MRALISSRETALELFSIDLGMELMKASSPAERFMASGLDGMLTTDHSISLCFVK